MSVKTMYLDAIDSFTCSRDLMIAQTSAVNTDADALNDALNTFLLMTIWASEILL